MGTTNRQRGVAREARRIVGHGMVNLKGDSYPVLGHLIYLRSFESAEAAGTERWWRMISQTL